MLNNMWICACVTRESHGPSDRFVDMVTRHTHRFKCLIAHPSLEMTISVTLLISHVVFEIRKRSEALCAKADRVLLQSLSTALTTTASRSPSWPP